MPQVASLPGNPASAVPAWAGTVCPGYGPLRPYNPAARTCTAAAAAPRTAAGRARKVVADIDAAFDACGITNGATLSFHHHLRNGDAVMNAVMAVASQRGLRDLTIAASSIFPIHAPLVPLIRAGVIGGIWTDYVHGPVADEIIAGGLKRPVIMQTHGGRARALASLQLQVDAAFIAAPCADHAGNLTGALGPSACGPLGYPAVDASYARHVVAVTDTLVTALPRAPEISAHQVDIVVPVAKLGDPAGIVSGATAVTRNAASSRFGPDVAIVLRASGLLREGFSFQTGSGSVSLAVVDEVGAALRAMRERGGFISGGVTAAHVELARAGLFKRLIDVQCFDLEAVASFRDHDFHSWMNAAEYASPIHPAAIVNQLDAVILGATEIDLDFNVNVTTSSDGKLIGGAGGHSDTAAGAKLTIIVTRLTAGGYAKVVDRVSCITTPGQDVDVLITDAGIAVNPARPDLAAALRDAGVPTLPIKGLNCIAAARAERRAAPRRQAPAVAIVEFRDGSVIDTV